jgi:hypothetical protein
MRTKGNGLVRAETTPGLVLVADGEHVARLVEVFPFANAHGDRLGFAYEIQAGPDAGAVVTQSASRGTSPTGKLAEILRALLGRVPTEAELAQAAGRQLLGVTCRITTRKERNRAGREYSAVVAVAR